MKVARQFATLLLTRWGSLGIAFATTVVSARALGPEGQGVVTLLLSTSDIMAVFLGAGLPTAAAYLIKQGRYTLGEVVGTIVAFYAVVGLGVVILVGNGHHLIGLLADRYMGIVLDPSWLWLLVGQLMGVLLSSLLGPLLIVGDRIRTYVWWSVAGQAIGLVLTWSLVVVLRLGVGGALAASLGAHVIAIGVLVHWLKQASSKRGFRLRGHVLLATLRIGLQQFLVSSCASLFKKGDSFILAALLDVRSVGFYSVASSLYDLVIDVPRTLVWPMVREIAERGPGEREQLTAKSIRLQIPASIGLAAAAAILVPFILPPIYGDPFRGAVGPFVILMGGVPLRAIHLAISAYFIGTGFPGAMLVPVVLAAVTSLGLDLVAVPRLGVLGAATTTVMGEFLLAVFSVRAFIPHTHGSGFRAVVPGKLEIVGVMKLPITLLRSLPGMVAEALGVGTRRMEK